MSEKFCVGFGRVDITPEIYGTLAGYGDDIKRPCLNILDRPLGTCVAFTDEKGETILVFTSDTHKVTGEMSELAEKLISEATGIPADHMVFCATHTHASPSVAVALDSVENYIRYWAKLMCKAAKEALEDRAPATAFAGKRIVKGMTFVRHYLMNDGGYSGPNFGFEHRPSGYKEHAAQADEQLQLVRFVRENARDIAIVNWQTHATTTGAYKGIKNDMSADYVGPMRDHFEGLTGCYFALYMGASGNLVPGSQLEGEARVEHDHIAYGKIMAEEAAKLLEEDMHPISAGPVHSVRMQYQGVIEHGDDHMADKAKYVIENYGKIEDKDARKALVRDNGFNSIYHARGVVRRHNQGQYLPMQINALHAGDIGFATVPFEMFCSNGKFVKQGSPFPVTFMLTNTNGTRSYLPDIAAYNYDCYEANSTSYAKGVAEDVSQTLVNMLSEMKAE